MEQMCLPFHPTHIDRQNQRDRRHEYAGLLRYPQRYRVHWQLWSGGTARLLLWGELHDAPPRAIHNPSFRHYDCEFEGCRHFYRLWGRAPRCAAR